MASEDDALGRVIVTVDPATEAEDVHIETAARASVITCDRGPGAERGPRPDPGGATATMFGQLHAGRRSIVL